MPDPNRPSLSTVQTRRSPLRPSAAATRRQSKTMDWRTNRSQFNSIRQRLRLFRSARSCNALSVCSLPLQALWSAAYNFAPGRHLQLSQCITYAPDVVTMSGRELLPVRPHFFDDWIVCQGRHSTEVHDSLSVIARARSIIIFCHLVFR